MSHVRDWTREFLACARAAECAHNSLSAELGSLGRDLKLNGLHRKCQIAVAGIENFRGLKTVTLILGRVCGHLPLPQTFSAFQISKRH